MSYFDDASLVFIPSGTKVSKAYSVKPIDGTGDLTFTRSNDTASRVASNGLIEKVRTNLVLQSNDFGNAAWSKIASGGTTPVLTSGFTDPNGGTNAWRLECSITGGTYSMIQQVVSTISLATASIYIKSNTGSNQNVYFRLNNSDSSTARVATAEWTRIEVTTTATGQTISVGVRNNATGATSSCDVLIYAAQVETGDIATDYIATTSAAVSVGPVANVPRLDYLGSSCPRLILEPQRQNLVTFSEQMDNAAWTKSNASVTANAATSPDGYTNADKIVENTATSGHSTFQPISVTSGATYTISAFGKAAERTRLWLDLYGGTNSANFDLSNGTILASSVGITAKIENYGNGWYRCSVTGVAPAATIYPNVGPTTSSTTANPYTGNGTSGIYVWGAQLELGSYPTSYVNTLGAAVTRGADAASKTGISSLIGQTEGTLFLDANVNITSTASNFAGIAINDGTSSNSVVFGYYQNGRIQAAVFAGGSIVVNIDLPSFGLTSGSHKFALAYKLNDYVFYVDGVQVGSDTSAAVPATSVLNISDLIGGDISHNQALLFKTRLTNAQLAELTTL